MNTLKLVNINPFALFKKKAKPEPSLQDNPQNNEQLLELAPWESRAARRRLEERKSQHELERFLLGRPF